MIFHGKEYSRLHFMVQAAPCDSPLAHDTNHSGHANQVKSVFVELLAKSKYEDAPEGRLGVRKLASLV